MHPTPNLAEVSIDRTSITTLQQWIRCLTWWKSGLLPALYEELRRGGIIVSPPLHLGGSPTSRLASDSFNCPAIVGMNSIPDPSCCAWSPCGPCRLLAAAAHMLRTGRSARVVAGEGWGRVVAACWPLLSGYHWTLPDEREGEEMGSGGAVGSVQELSTLRVRRVLVGRVRTAAAILELSRAGALAALESGTGGTEAATCSSSRAWRQVRACWPLAATAATAGGNGATATHVLTERGEPAPLGESDAIVNAPRF